MTTPLRTRSAFSSALPLLAAVVLAAVVPASPAQTVIPAGLAVPPADVKKDDKDKPKPIKEVLPDAKKIDGLLTFYQKKDKLFAEIKSSNLNTDYLIAMAIAKGSGWSAIGGYTLQFGDDWLWQFRKVDDKIQVVRRNIRFKADSGTPEAKAVEVAYSDSILYSLPILAIGEGGGDVIDLASIFMSDLPGLRIGSFDRSRSNWGEVKGFGNNMEFRVVATYSGGSFGYYSRGSSASPDPKSVGVTLHYSISKLPSGGYTPRLADPRIGYFTTTHTNYSRAAEDEHQIRYINRWNLQKADPNAALSPPKKPIVFWIEKTVPFKYRDAVRQGILEWNKAFEKAGFVNAIEVRQQADSDTWDSEDVNYNTFRWITSDAGFAMGPSRVNPLTGEIIDADIIFDAGWIDFWQLRFDYQVAELINPPSKRDADQQKTGDKPVPFARYREKMEANKAAQEHSHDAGHYNCTCSYIQEKASQIALLALAVDAEDKAEEKEEAKKKEADAEKSGNNNSKDGDKTSEDKKPEEKKDETAKNDSKETGKDGSKDGSKDAGKKAVGDTEKDKKRKEKLEKFIQESVKDVVMHEVGHTLGLRHNFQASSWLTLQEMNRPDRSKEYGIAGSVMDYLALNLVPKGKVQGDYFMTALGPYDHLAIEYGYKIISGGTDGETKELSKIAAKQAEKGNNYATDEDLRINDSLDPRTLPRDLGSEPLDYAKTILERYNQFLPEILERAVRENGSYRDVGRYYVMLVADRYRSTSGLSASIGGLYRNRDRKGDPGNRLPVQPVEAAKQREAVKWLSENMFAADAFKISPDIYNKFGQEVWLSGNSITAYGGFPLGLVTAVVQCHVLEDMIGPWVLTGLADTAFRVKEGEDALTADELFDSVTTAVFSELKTIKVGEFTSRKPAVPSARQTLQLHYFEILSMYALGQLQWNYFDTDFGQALTRMQLRQISADIKALLANGNVKLDSGSRSHLTVLGDRIDQVLKASVERWRP
ncbi:MAG: zinc-dependent metalloprotease [Planctomycetaceae bacterium]|jgi:hypothetical protein|nr:zinc-dependent metalloprotease [Planctomycetaceae bacterium]